MSLNGWLHAVESDTRGQYCWMPSTDPVDSCDEHRPHRGADELSTWWRALIATRQAEAMASDLQMNEITPERGKWGGGGYTCGCYVKCGWLQLLDWTAGSDAKKRGDERWDTVVSPYVMTSTKSLT